MDIVERLRNRKINVPNDYYGTDRVADRECIEAADTIEALRSEIEASEQKHLDYVVKHKQFQRDVWRLEKEIEALKAANEWQVVGTAPLDGTKVLVSYSCHGIECLQYDVDLDYWTDSHSGEPWTDNFTHWKPLQAPEKGDGV